MSFYMIPNILRHTKNYRKCIGMNKFQNLFPMIDKVRIISVHYFTIHQCEKMPLDCNDLLNVLMTLYSEGHCNANLPCKVFPKFTNNRIYDYPSNRVLKNSVVISLE